jgi:hypothetical protein
MQPSPIEPGTVIETKGKTITVLGDGVESWCGKRTTLCRCECGKEFKRRTNDVKRGRILSCGCIVPRHGQSGSPEHRSWKAMRRRCSNPNTSDWKDYGGKGIKVCDRWNDFRLFFQDMGPRPQGCTLDRIDSSKGYSPDNCRWSTSDVQSNNRRTNRKITIGSETLGLAQWCRKIGIKLVTVKRRIKAGMSDIDALTKPVTSKRRKKE